MNDDQLIEKPKTNIEAYVDDIPVRGYEFDLAQFKGVYRELSTITQTEGDRFAGTIQKPEGQADEDFRRNLKAEKERAFKVTVSIIGFDGQITYDDRADIFDSKNLPSPIKTIFISSRSAFLTETNGREPENYFNIWVHFNKPPLFDTNPLVSNPTENHSQAVINSKELGYFRAVQNVINTRLKKNRIWYSFIHGRFVYDIGLWFIALPYALYMITVYMDHFLPSDSKYSSFRIAFFIYGMGLSLISYRALMGYLKWAFPVNVLAENKDTAKKHRWFFGVILLGLIGAAIKAAVGL